MNIDIGYFILLRSVFAGGGGECHAMNVVDLPPLDIYIEFRDTPWQNIAF
jgi:hypothetical protein